MARNPEYCLTADGMARPVRRVDARAHAGGTARRQTSSSTSVPLYGDLVLADDAAQLAQRRTRGENRLFQRLLVANALQAEPPLGWIRTFRTDDGELRRDDRPQDARHPHLRRRGARVRACARHRRDEYVAAPAPRGPAPDIATTARRGSDRRRLPLPADAAPAGPARRPRCRRAARRKRRPSARGARSTARSLCAQRTRPAHAHGGFPPGARAAARTSSRPWATDARGRGLVAVPAETLRARRTRRALPAGVACAPAGACAVVVPRSAGSRRADRTGTTSWRSISRPPARDMLTDRIISIGAIAVTARTVRHDDAFEVVFRQQQSSATDNILVHQIGGQEQRGGADPDEGARGVPRVSSATPGSSHSARSSTPRSSGAKCGSCLGMRAWPRFLDLANVLAALFPEYRERVARRLDDALRPAADRPPPRDRRRLRDRPVADDRARTRGPDRRHDVTRPARRRARPALAWPSLILSASPVSRCKVDTDREKCTMPAIPTDLNMDEVPRGIVTHVTL